MATPTQRRSYENISRKGISRYKGSIRKKDDAVVIIGPITKLMPPHKKHSRNRWRGCYVLG